MINFRRTIKRQSLFLFSEFVVVVLGVLVALAVDEWRSNLAFEKQRSYILTSLLTDLKEDRVDYDHFVADARSRANAVRYLVSLRKGEDIDGETWDRGPGQAIFQIAAVARLQTTRSAFVEMSATGLRMTIAENELRSRILRYYALATDRAAINDIIAPEVDRFHQALENLGVAFSDGDEIDPDLVLGDPTALALIRSIGSVAVFATAYVADLMQANSDLIEVLELQLSEI